LFVFFVLFKTVSLFPICINPAVFGFGFLDIYCLQIVDGIEPCFLGLFCLFVVFCLVVVVGFLWNFIFAGLRFWLWLRFGLVFGVCLVVVVVVAYLGTTVTNCSGCICVVA
jgi:hypothetical protein